MQRSFSKLSAASFPTMSLCTKHSHGKLKLAKKDSRESDTADNEHNFEHYWHISWAVQHSIIFWSLSIMRFGRLKVRFGTLKKPMDINLSDLPSVIYACFVLHNFCEMNNESVAETRIQGAIDYDREFQPACTTSRYTTSTGSNENAGKGKRRILAKFFDPWWTVDLVYCYFDPSHSSEVLNHMQSGPEFTPQDLELLILEECDGSK